MTPSRLIASGLGSGLLGRAPGTAGSLLALALGAGLMAWSPFALPFAILAVLPVGLWAITAAGGTADPGWVVIDEFAGQWITLLALPAPSPLGLLLCFGLFRMLDIAKPGPIGWSERLPGALGVMADDIVAGVIGAAAIWCVTALLGPIPG